MTLTERNLVKAYAAALAGKACNADFADVKSAEFFRLAMSQGVASSVYYSLSGADIPAELRTMLEDVHNQALLWDLSREEEEKRVFAAFDKAELNYLPLKGSVMRMYYPSTDMRLMGDTDIMIERFNRKDAKKVMESCGYKRTDSHSGHDIYKHENGNVFELHWKPADSSDFHKNLMERALPVGEKGFRLSLNLSDFYIYMLSHFARHVRTSGAGIRMLADIKVFFSRCGLKLDDGYVKSVLESMGLVRFEIQVKKLIHCLFYGNTPDELTQNFADYILSGGVFGSAEISAANKRGDKSRLGYFISSVFPSFGAMKERYPFLKYLPFLLPLMWVFRWFSLLFRGKKPAARYAKGASVDKATLKRNKQLMTALDIKRYKNGKQRMTAGDIATALLLICVLVFAILFIGTRLMTPGRNSTDTSDEEVLHNSDEPSSEEISEDGASDEPSFDIPEREYGTIAYREGLYTGWLVQGVPDGTGTLVFNSGESYSGSFSEGMFNGNGLYKYNDGSRYDGIWYEDEINGTGTWYFPDGGFVSGTFFEGKPTGVCVYECANGDMYEGTLKDGKWHGKGKFVWTSGDVYEGDFVMGVRHGQGKYLYSNGDSYEGGWINNVQNGKGTYVIGGNSYTGVFVEGVLEGEGTALFKNGDHYKGYFVHNKYHDDEAVLTFAAGGSYSGGFEDGKFSGYGVIAYADGDMVKGDFVEGFLQGKAQYYYGDEEEWRTITYVDGKPQ
ncbi:MAG: hypothetical protein E7597_00950 [Ruminococcaceae bacterium]|nr:hypothetical protein [Oscillospiraceae bacterium]